MSCNNPRYRNGAARRNVRARVVARGEPCWICGLPIDWGLPRGNPEAGQVDEVVPVSQGGSPYQASNCLGAHACCNNWRKVKSAGEVRAIQESVRNAYGSWMTPEEFVAKAKALKQKRKPNAIAFEQLHTSTDW